MNWLAHLLLSRPDPEERLGQLLADVIKPNQRIDWPVKVSSGASLHLEIDHFTDQHPLFKRSRQRLAIEWRRFGGIIVDLFYDHFLSRQWSQWSGQKLEDFVAEVHRQLRLCPLANTTGVKPFLDRLIGERWLLEYSTIEGMERTFWRVSRRLSRPNLLHGAEQELLTSYNGFEDDFSCFFPELVQFVQQREAELDQLTMPAAK